MRNARFDKIIMMMLLGSLVAACGWARPAQSYTARAFIGVLPYPDQDPTVIETPVFDRETQNKFRRSRAALMKEESFLQDLLGRDKVRNTAWFRSIGDDKAIVTPEMLSDLGEKLQAVVSDDTDLIEVSMTCAQPQDAADIVNEAVDLFVSGQRDRRVSRVRTMLVELEKRRSSLEQDLALAEKALADVWAATGLTDLEQRDYPFPQEVRLNRLQQTRDELEIALAEAQALASYTARSNQDPNEQQPQIVVLRAKLQQVEKMLGEAAAEKKRLDLATVQYRQRERIRDQIRSEVDQIKTLIEKRRIQAEDPETPKVQSVGRAVVPVKPD